MFLYVSDHGVAIDSPTIYASDGVTLLLPVSATVDILNMDAGTSLVSAGTCTVASGSASYTIPSGSAVTSSSAHCVAYFAVEVTADSRRTYVTYFDVLDKASYLILDRWRRKVESSSPDDSLITDEAARDWIDDAVDYVHNTWGITDYTSTLGVISPTPTSDVVEFYASVASLMARTSWWAGRGRWRDGEMSLDPGPFRDEWERLRASMQARADKGVFAVFEVFNRDHVYDDGHKWDSPLWPYLPSGTSQPVTDIPI